MLKILPWRECVWDEMLPLCLFSCCERGHTIWKRDGGWDEQSADFLFTCCCFRRRSCLLTLTPPSVSLFLPLLSHHTLSSIPFHHHRGKSDGALRPLAVKGTRGAKVEWFLAHRWERRGLRSGFGASREWRKGRDGRKGEDRHAAAAQSR